MQNGHDHRPPTAEEVARVQAFRAETRTAFRQALGDLATAMNADGMLIEDQDAVMRDFLGLRAHMQYGRQLAAHRQRTAAQASPATAARGPRLVGEDGAPIERDQPVPAPEPEEGGPQA